VTLEKHKKVVRRERKKRKGRKRKKRMGKESSSIWFKPLQYY